MSSWIPQLPRLSKPRIHQATPLAELRQFYETMAAGFGPVASDIVAEPTQLGQVKGEWVRVGDNTPERVVLYLHGGGFVSGSPEAHRPLVARLCRAAEAVAFSVAYRLAPEFPFPAALRDVVDCYRVLTGKGIAPESIVIAGDGAGGGLAFATVMAIRNAHMPMPAACVAMSPWADLTLSGWSMLQHQESDVVFSRDILFACARHYLHGGNPGDPYASPVFGDMRDFPPIMVHAGSLELLRDDAGRLGELAAQSGVPVSVEVYDGQRHLFQTGSSSEAKVSMMRLGQFIKARTPEQPAKVNVAKKAQRR